MIDAFCKDCEAQGTLRKSTHVFGADPVCNGHYLLRMRTGADAPAASSQALRALEAAKHEKDRPMPKKADVDWPAIQQLRDSGKTLEECAQKAGVSQATVHAHTRAAKRGPKLANEAAMRPGRLEQPSLAETNKRAIAKHERRSPDRNDGGMFTQLLADLRQRREEFQRKVEAMDAAIAALDD